MSKKIKALIIIAAAVFLAMVSGVAYYLISYRVVNVPTGAMANTIIPGDKVLCSMRLGEIKRGDIVLFTYPTEPKAMFLKRVIGLPEETIQVKGHSVFINGNELPEERALVRLLGQQSPVVKVEPKPQGASYRVFYEADRYSDGDDFEINRDLKYGVVAPYKIPPGQYFLMGDSRDNSMDSRYLGTVPREMIAGKAIMIVNSTAKGAEDRSYKSLE
jgi:signal peptidase I